jgi:hypothetical protein
VLIVFLHKELLVQLIEAAVVAAVVVMVTQATQVDQE